MDPRGRVYYVDHNTRTTTWQRPNTDMLNNYSAWQDHRNHRNIQLEHLQNRFLFPNPQTAPQDNDPLGPLPEGWGKWQKCIQYFSHVHCVFTLFYPLTSI